MDTTVKIPDMPELRFDEKSHIYRLDGVEIPSVSKVMEPLKASSYAGVSEKTLARAADKRQGLAGKAITERRKDGLSMENTGADPS